MSFKSVEIDHESLKKLINLEWLNIDAILDLKVENFLNEGENYGSIMRMIQITGDKQGEIVNRSIIMKKDRILPDDIVFPFCKFEIQIYTEILPKMKELIDKLHERDSKVKLDVMWPICLGVRNYDIILLEDLRETNHVLRNRRIPMPPEVGCVVFENLGKFHALSVIAVKRNLIDVNGLPSNRYAENMPVLNNIFRGGLITLADAIQTHPKWSHICDRLRSLASNVGDEIIKVAEKTKDIFPVLCHGDCWSNNILLKYNPDSQVPASIKFVDFQICHYSCFAWDIIQLMNSSMSGKDKQTSFEQFITIYRRSLLEILMAFDEIQLAEAVPSLKQMYQTLDDLSLYAMVVSFSLFPLTVNTMEKAWDFEKAISNENVNVHLIEMYTNKTFVDSFEIDVVRFKSQGLL